MNRSKLLIGLATLAGLALLVFWIDHQYLPRPRPGSPLSDSPAGRLLASDEFPVVLWMPHPHQNLGFLRDTLGASADSLRSLPRLAGLPTPGVPSFGPLAVPPAAEMALASDEAGERYAVFAEVYPAFAAFARLAGRLADNPWLKGGEIYVEGRWAEVRWLGDTWAVASPEFPSSLDVTGAGELPGFPAGAGEMPALPAGGAMSAGEPALAMIEVRQAVRPLSAGRYRLVQRNAGFEIVSEGAEVPAEAGFQALELSSLDVFLFAFAGASRVSANRPGGWSASRRRTPAPRSCRGWRRSPSREATAGRCPGRASQSWEVRIPGRGTPPAGPWSPSIMRVWTASASWRRAWRPSRAGRTPGGRPERCGSTSTPA